MLSFFAAAFAVAGAVAALGPLVIHLLNRRRYRVVDWAAMDFLREAMQRNRRILHLRDILLLVLRTLCVLLFGLAMGRPYFTRTAGEIDPDQPLHAILLVDNSLSMAYAKLDGTLLDEARAKGGEFIQRLPPGSRITVLPLCGSEEDYSLDPYRTKDDALRALSRIEVVDRSASAAQAADLAIEACRRATDLPAKRVLLLGDQQAINWPAGSLAAQFGPLPELQIVQIARPELENAWVADFELQDGVADVESTGMFLATVRYEGPSPRSNVQVTLTIDGTAAASKTISLEPGQAAEVSFPYRFDLAPEPGQANFISAEVSLPPDHLPQDDRRMLMVPVVAALPVVFVDQYGDDEEPQKNLYGETFLLRRLLAPVTTRGDFGRQLIQVRHLRVDEVDRDVLQDARLVVMAGVADPDETVDLLREYLQQGGQLVICAGGDFEPNAWQAAAWRDGAGILPAPLANAAVGQLPSDANGPLRPFQLAFASMSHDYFLIENEDRTALEDLYGVPVFFKAVEARVDPSVLDELLTAETQRLEQQRDEMAELEERLGRLPGAAGDSDPESDMGTHVGDEQRRRELSPDWLVWRQPALEDDSRLPADELARRTLPRVLASYTNKIPFMVQRQIGRGQVLFVSTGVFANASSATPGWNNLATTDAVLLFDRIFRDMLQRTLPQRNLDSVESLTLPIAAGDRRDRFLLTRPGGGLEPLGVDALGSDLYGVTVRNVAARGLYRITALKPESAELQGRDERHWEVTLAVNGPAIESELRSLNESALADRLKDVNYRFVPGGEEISLEGAQVEGQGLWRWFLASLLVCLALEMLVLAWPTVAKEAAA
jgi:hypothetical protein